MIYFIKHTDYVKIGYTNRIHKRLHALQVSSPVKLKVLGLIAGEFEDEKKYHDFFKQYYSHGEWFHYHRALSSHIEKLDNDLMWKYGFANEQKSPIGEIKKIRLESGVSMEELGVKMNISKQSVHSMENREVQGNISINTLKKAADALGYKYDYRIIKKTDK